MKMLILAFNPNFVKDTDLAESIKGMTSQGLSVQTIPHHKSDVAPIYSVQLIMTKDEPTTTIVPPVFGGRK